MVTMGDAIAEFLETRHYKFPDADAQVESSSHSRQRKDPVRMRLAEWTVGRPVSWARAVSGPVWRASLFVFGVGLAVPSTLLGISLQHLKTDGFDISPAGISRLGFTLNSAFLVTGTTSGQFGGSGSNVIIANSFQILVSLLYLFYNNILTSQLVADEWTRFLRPDGKKTLRVSSPQGMQRSSYTLSLPFKYSIPLAILMMALHTLVSQSIFVISLAGFGPGPDPVRLPIFDKSSVGYSPLGISLSLGLVTVMILALVVNSLARRYPAMPENFASMGMCSAAISALSQRPDEDPDASLFPLRLGVIKSSGSGGEETGRLMFSTSIVIEEPRSGETRYPQPVTVSFRRSGWLRRIKATIIAAIGSVCAWIASARLTRGKQGR
ncbi:hypothetical protein Daus18300_010664 [Diaporthe australafricana]|uniref:Uncharacterized protein n=1 Tax=Diaporthe australafricana TaxID=127596 RepID=A0ABR3WA88_9PEZI